ncbi:GNAT family N-acetyltransferase [Enterobacteriaceae bacterium RIT814]|nr:GNAT family N-acetyltransferase [Enterobacteriaceae bacterium RIT 814]
MQLRKAQAHEAEALWNLRNLAIRHGCVSSYSLEIIRNWTPEAMPEHYRKMIIDNPFYVIDAQGVLAASGYLDLNAASVEAIFTLPGYTGKGLASQIIAAIKDEAAARGITRLTLEATPNAADFYLRHGFEWLGESMHPSAMARAELRCVNMAITL